MAEEKKTVECNKIKYKVWAKNEWEKAKAGVRYAWNWTLEHPVEAVAFAGVGLKLTDKVSKMYCAHKEDVRRERNFYDTRTGKNTKANRRPTHKQAREIDERFKRGESYISILSDMGLY